MNKSYINYINLISSLSQKNINFINIFVISYPIRIHRFILWILAMIYKITIYFGFIKITSIQLYSWSFFQLLHQRLHSLNKFYSICCKYCIQGSWYICCTWYPIMGTIWHMLCKCSFERWNMGYLLDIIEYLGIFVSVIELN